MKRAHLFIGLLSLVVFLGTGMAMTLQSPPLADQDSFVRLLFRSRHIYLLSAAAANALLGVYLQPRLGASRWLQAAGSGLLLIAPALALLGFGLDARGGSLEAAIFGKYAAFALFGGALLHLLAALPWSKPRH